MSPSQNLWSDLLADFQNPNFQWQVLALLICAVIGYLLSRGLMKHFSGDPNHQSPLGAALTSFQRVLTPLLTLPLIALSMGLLGRSQSVGLLRMAMPLVLSFLLIRLVFYMLRQAFVKDGRIGGFLQAFEQSFALIVWTVLALYITGLWPDVMLFLDETTLPVGRHRESLLVILQAILSVGVTLILALWASAMLEQRLMRLDTVHSSLRAVLSRVVRAVLILIAVLLSLSMVGIDLTVLSVFGGALGVGIGLGLQKLVSSYVSGFVILLERSLSIGDVVNVDRFSGQVVQINTRYTVLKGTDGAESVIPNEMLVSSPVQNLSLTSRHVRLTTSFIVAHETDMDRLFAEIDRTLSGIPRVLAEPQAALLLSRFAPEGLELEVVFWIDDPENGRGSVMSAVNLALLKLLKEQGVRLSPQLPREPSVADLTNKSLIHKTLSDDLA